MSLPLDRAAREATCRALVTSLLFTIPTAGCTARWPHEDRAEDVAMRMVSEACDHPDDVARHWLSYDELIAMTQLRPSREAYEHDVAWWAIGACDDLRSAPAYGRKVVGAVATPAAGDPRLVPGVTAVLIGFTAQKLDGSQSTSHALLFVKTEHGWRLADPD